MAAFEAGLELRRLAERGISQDGARISIYENLKSLTTERTQTANPFDLRIKNGQVLADGFEQRGDLTNSFEMSVENESDIRRAARFRLENEGYERAKNMFAKAPIGSTVMLASPPPQIPIEGYPGYNLLYFYLVKEGEAPEDRKIQGLSVINRFSNEEQAEIINKIGGTNVAPTEKDILTSPIAVFGNQGDLSSFRSLWKVVEEVYNRKERDFKLISQGEAENYLLYGTDAWEERNKILSTLLKENANDFVNGNMSKDRLAIALNYADLNLHNDVTKDWEDLMEEREESTLPPGVIFDRLSYLNHSVAFKKTSCGDSGDIVLNNPLNSFMGNPNGIRTVSFGVSTFSKENEGATIFGSKKDEKEDYLNDENLCKCGGKAAHFHCPGVMEVEKEGESVMIACKNEIIVGRGIERCPKCKTGKVC